MPIRFHDFELDEARFALTRAGRPVPLRPKAFDLLAYLIRHRHRVVRREELIGAVWGTTRVGMGSLSGLVNEVRQALGEAAGADSSIQTVHARGYRFVAPVLREGDGRHGEHDGPAATGAGPDPTDSRPCGAFGDGGDGDEERPDDPFARVSERGAWGLLVETSCGGAGDSASERVAARVRTTTVECLVEHAEAMGFETWEIVAPHEAMATVGRLAGDLLARALSERPRPAVLASLPLPARAGVEERCGVGVAGGAGASPGAPIGGLSAIGSMLARLARHRPIMLVLHAVSEAGAVYGADIGRLVRELGTAPVLVVIPLEAVEANPGAARVRRQLLARAGFESWRGRPATTAEPGIGPLSDFLRRRDLPPLPREVERALLEYLLGRDSAASEPVSRIEHDERPRPERVRVRRVEPKTPRSEAGGKA